MRTPSGFGLIHATSLAYERDLNPEVKRNEVTMVSKYNAERKYLEEQRAELIERGKNMSRNKSTDCEETSDFDSDDDNEEMFTF